MMVERISTFEPGRSVGASIKRLNSEASMWRRSMRRAVISWTLRSCCVKVFGRAITGPIVFAAVIDPV
jgi:hypothetical protein